MKYRPEIDGLRAIAVLSVILYHAGLNSFSGGFVGVDIFFVISGYLITNIIYDELAVSRFSIRSFYERRARRILPALFIVSLVCIPFAWFWMPPNELKDFSQSLVAVATFTSNILFWQESGYFAASAELKPLLHTWSLAVEEQFYIFYPPLLLALIVFLPKALVLVIISGLLMSLGLANWASLIHPTANFYLPFSRGWELGAGALIAIHMHRLRIRSMLPESRDSSFGVPRPVGTIRELTGAIGLGFIGYAIFAFDKTTPYPSLWTLIPVVGTALIILATGSSPSAAPSAFPFPKKILIGRLLSLRILVGIGLISYSAYLWHHPLFAFARIYLVEGVSVEVYLALMIASLTFGVISYKYIEKPFRGNTLSSRSFLLISVFFACLLILVGFSLPEINSLRFNDSQKSVLAEGANNREVMANSAYDRKGCFIDQNQDAYDLIKNNCVHRSEKSRLIIFGDSEAAHLLDGMISVFKSKDVMQFTQAGCRAINYSTNHARCKYFYNLFVSDIIPQLTKDDTVILSSNWFNTYEEVGDSEFRARLAKILSSLRQSTKEIYVFTSAPGFFRDPYGILATKKITNAAGGVYLKSQPTEASDSLIEEVAEKVGVSSFNVAKQICANEGMCLFKDSNNYLYFDRGHFSFYGSRYIARRFGHSFAEKK